MHGGMVLISTRLRILRWHGLCILICWWLIFPDIHFWFIAIPQVIQVTFFNLEIVSFTVHTSYLIIVAYNTSFFQKRTLCVWQTCFYITIIRGITRNMEHIPSGSLSFATRNLSAGTCIELQKLNHRKKGGPINNEILTEDHFTHKLISHLLLVPDHHHHERRAIHAGDGYTYIPTWLALKPHAKIKVWLVSPPILFLAAAGRFFGYRLTLCGPPWHHRHCFAMCKNVPKVLYHAHQLTFMNTGTECVMTGQDTFCKFF